MKRGTKRSTPSAVGTVVDGVRDSEPSEARSCKRPTSLRDARPEIDAAPRRNNRVDRVSRAPIAPARVSDVPTGTSSVALAAPPPPPLPPSSSSSSSSASMTAKPQKRATGEQTKARTVKEKEKCPPQKASTEKKAKKASAKPRTARVSGKDARKKKAPKKKLLQTWTVTFGDVGENHVGNQRIGERLGSGLTCDELGAIESTPGAAVEVYELASRYDDAKDKPEREASTVAPRASVVVIRNGVDRLRGGGATARLRAEIQARETDKHALMRGKVKNKRARHNLVFGDVSQTADYAAGKGTVVAFSELPELAALRASLPDTFGPKARALVGELNHYYDISKCGIGMHGDAERDVAIGVRLGATMKLVFQWYHRWVPVGEPLVLELNEGDVYAMSHVATGYNWKSSSIPTLRHAAGCDKYTRRPMPRPPSSPEDAEEGAKSAAA